MPDQMESQFRPAGLTEKDAEDLRNLLQDRLYGLLDLTLVIKHAHWNVVGVGFIAVHEMLDEHLIAIRKMVDEVAERIATLGFVPNGLAGGLVEARNWDDYALGRASVDAHLAALNLVYTGVIEDHRKALEKAESLDPVTTDLFTQQLGPLELYQWFVRAHLANVDGVLVSAGEETEESAAAAAASRRS